MGIWLGLYFKLGSHWKMLSRAVILCGEPTSGGKEWNSADQFGSCCSTNEMMVIRVEVIVEKAVTVEFGTHFEGRANGT